MATNVPQIVVSLPSLEEQIRQHRSLIREVANAQERVRLQERKLQAMGDLLGVDWTKMTVADEPAAPVGPLQAPPPPKVARKKMKPRKLKVGGWTDTILRVLREANRGLAHAALYKALEGTDFAKTVTFNQKRYYTTISRLQQKKQVIRAGVLIYAPEVAKKLEKEGPLPTVDLEVPRLFDNKVQTPHLIQRLLQQHPDGLQGNDLVGRLSMMEDAPESVRTHPQFVYTTLSNMIRKGTVKREGGVYRLVENRNGPTGGTVGPLH